MNFDDEVKEGEQFAKTEAASIANFWHQDFRATLIVFALGAISMGAVILAVRHFAG